MEIGGNIPFHVAQAYGVRCAPALGHAARMNETAIAARAASALPSAPPTGAGRSAALERMVAATVHRPIDFNGAATVSPHAALQLYTRAADKVEAAVAVDLGRAIDVIA